jgi:HAD superfamily hydrolase (TIGR01459 family)
MDKSRPPDTRLRRPTCKGSDLGSNSRTGVPGVIPIVTHLAPISVGIVAWICDLWGVVHNGTSVFPDAIKACRAFRAQGGIVLFVSNAPRPSAAVAAQLGTLGVPNDASDLIVSSGDITRDMLRDWGGCGVHHIGPERDLGLFEGLDLKLTSAEQADVAVCSGLFDDTIETPETYRHLLAMLHGAAVPMICANPDIQVERGGQNVWCAGAIAGVYGAMGGRVDYAGKPHPAVYARAFAEIDRINGAPVPRDKILAIGDGVNTDIRGAASCGIPSVYIASRVHLSEPLSAGALAQLFAADLRPIAAQSRLKW